MGRKKKQQQETSAGESHSSIGGDVKRSVVAIFLFALAVLFVLGFVSDAGILGKYINLLVGMMFGWGKWISPFVLIAVGIVLLFRKETLFYVSKILGLSAAFFSLLAFFHIFFDGSDMLVKAREGAGGGYFGYLFSMMLIKLTGKVGAIVILIATLSIGVIVAFNFSIVKLVKKFIRKKVEEYEEVTEDDGDDMEEEIPEDPVVEKSAQGGSAAGGDTEFVHDPNEEEDKSMPKESILRKAVQWMPKKNKQKKEALVAWAFPPIDLLEASSGKAQGGDVKKNSKIIQDTFKHFGIDVEPAEILTGPTVTQYSFRPAVGVKLTRITSLSNDLALALAAHPIRIEAPIPGKSLIGIEVPNKTIAKVCLPELLDAEEFEERQTNLLLALGKDVSGNYIYGDLKKMPHLMIAGSTGSGKSVCVNTILISLLYQNSPEDMKLILVDPKRVELSLYNGIPHLLADVIVENSKVLSALKWAISEMERRYKLLQEVGSRDIMSYNSKVEAGETRTVTNTETNETTEESIEKLPYIVIVIDELADLMASHGKEVEGAIIRLAQMARAIGIHLIVSTQRPSVEVITGLIKANIPTRIAFKVATQIDSRTILDGAGAEKLLGNGDMLFSSTAVAGMRRLQGIYVSEAEVKRVVDFIKKQKFNRGEDDLADEITKDSNGVVSHYAHSLPAQQSEKLDFDSMNFSDQQEDSMYEEAKRIVIESRKASTSYLQRRLRIGYGRAARIIDMLEEQGVIGPGDGARPREVLVGEGNSPAYEDSTDDQALRDKWQM